MGRKEVWGAEKYLVSGRRGLVRKEKMGVRGGEQMRGDDLLLSIPLEDHRGRIAEYEAVRSHKGKSQGN